jgi:hypothetical protein
MIPSFTKWLSSRGKKQTPPVPGRMSSEESKALLSKKPAPETPRTIDPDALEAAWKDSATADPRTGITDAQRKAANANNPKFHMDPDELERAWRASFRSESVNETFVLDRTLMDIYKSTSVKETESYIYSLMDAIRSNRTFSDKEKLEIFNRISVIAQSEVRGMNQRMNANNQTV